MAYKLEWTLENGTMKGMYEDIYDVPTQFKLSQTEAFQLSTLLHRQALRLPIDEDDRMVLFDADVTFARVDAEGPTIRCYVDQRDEHDSQEWDLTTDELIQWTRICTRWMLGF